jgi:bile acid:Na+ symporter, BASS family
MSNWVAAIPIAAVAILAVAVRKTRFSGFALALWIIVFVSTSLVYPRAFDSWFGFKLGRLIVPLIQIILFGMGTQLTVEDFLRVLRLPKPVLVGSALHYTIMPLLGKLLAVIFKLKPEVAAGMVLLGSCPSGVTSNVIVYLAGGSVALSVTLSSLSTLLSPLATPAAMQLLAGTYVQVHFISMMMEILRMIVIPIGFGLAANWILVHTAKRYPPLQRLSNAIMEGLPVVSMFGICLILAIIVNLSRTALLSGRFVIAIIAAAALHNFGGYFLGYWGSRITGNSEMDSRTVAIEVGMQNAGLASALAIGVLHSPLAALPPAVFSTIQSTSATILASWWAKRPVQSDDPLIRGAADAPSVSRIV